MSKISELGSIKGSNTRSEDLFVIVNLIQGDDGTKNITRKELVDALQYEIFARITITGGNISGVRIFSATLDNNVLSDNQIINGTMEGTDITEVTIDTAEAKNITMSESEIANSDFSEGTGNNNIFTNTIVDQGELNNSTGNNNVFTNSRIDDSEYNNVTIDQGTANGLILTNIEIDELILEDAFISNSEIITTWFHDGDISNVAVSNATVVDSDFSNGVIRTTRLDDVDITNSRFSNGTIWDSGFANNIHTTSIFDNNVFSNGEIFDTNANNVVMQNSEIYNITGNNVILTNMSNSDLTTSDFSNGTGNNNIWTNSTIDTAAISNATLANSSFTGSMDGVVANDLTITSSSANNMSSTSSTFDGGKITRSTFEDGTIDESNLVDFDMELHKVWEPNMDENSYFAIKNSKTGQTEQISYKQMFEEISKSTEKGLKVYVASDGNDEYPGTILQPVRTLKRAAAIALEKAGGSYDRNDINNAVHISVGPGVYWVDEPIWLPDDCAMSSTAGQYATVIRKLPGWERTNGILVGSGCYVQGFAYMNFEVDNFDYPEGGFAIAYRPNALLRRSPYIRDSSQLSNFNRLDVEPPLSPFNSKGTIADLGQEFILETGHSVEALFEDGDEVTFSSGATGFISWTTNIDSDHQIYVRNLKGNVEVGDYLYAQRGGTGQIKEIGIDDFPNRLVGRGGGCLLADRRVLDADSLYTYVLCFGFTPRTQNGVGYVARDGAGVNGIGSLSIFVRTAFYALNGGQMTLNNSGTQFGDISMRAKGSTNIVLPDNINSSLLLSNTDFAEELLDNKEVIIEDMIDYLTANTSSGGAGYQGYNADKCYRDSGIIADNIGYDVALNTNYWGRLNGITYSSPISYVVKNEQLTETVGANEHLRDQVKYLFRNANTVINDRVDVSMNETLNILKNGEENASDIIFADTGDVARTNARELIQDNKELIIQGMIDWIDNNDNFFAYDSKTCQRDIEKFILPAVKYDMLLDTNYNSVTAGNAYYFNQAKLVLDNQREETVGAYKKLRKETDRIIEANTALGAVRAYDKFNQIIDIIENNGTKYTPTNVSYDPATGEAVFTIGAHSLTVGRYINLMPESLQFTCDTDNNTLIFSHPRLGDPATSSALPILSVTSTTFTVNVGATPYKGVHTFVKAEFDSVSVVGTEITFSDSTSISADRRNARKQLQTNKDYIQSYMMDWADSNYFLYDSEKCQRDTQEYILPAVKRDMVSGSNFNAIQSGIAYRQGITTAVPGSQLTETVGAFTHLKSEVEDALSDPIAIYHANEAFDNFINIMQNDGREFTPSDATYDPSTGVSELTIENHGFEVGDQILLSEEGLTFSCANTANASVITEISHPRSTDPAFESPITIFEATDNTIKIYVGGANGYTGAHTFARAKLNCVKQYTSVNDSYTPTDATYNPNTGITVLTIPEHGIKVGDRIVLNKESITFSCANTSSNTVVSISHPRFTDPNYNSLVEITGITDDTITFFSGDAGGYTGAHTFVSADANCVKTVGFPNNKFTPTNATYNVLTGISVITVGPHSIKAGDTIKIAEEALTFECGSPAVQISHPRSTDPAFNTDLTVLSVTDTTISVNVGNAGGYTGAHTFISAKPLSITKTSAYSGKVTPTDAIYDPVTGDMTFVIGHHNLNIGKWISMAPESITMTCANTANASYVETISHPRPTDPAYNSPVRITDVTGTTITVNVGNAGGYSADHSFVSALDDCIDTNAIYWTDAAKIESFHTPETATYDPATGDFVVTITGHGLTTNDHIEIKPESFRFSCANTAANTTVEISNPRIGDMAYGLPLEITAATTNTFTVNVGAANGYTGAHTFVSADADAIMKVSATQDGTYARRQLQANKKFIQDEIDAWIRDNYFVYKDALCKRDTDLILKAVARDVLTGSNVNSVFHGLAYRSGNASTDSVVENELTETVGALEWLKEEIWNMLSDADAKQYANNAFDATIQTLKHGSYTPTNATYDPVTGISEITIGSHTFTTGDTIYLKQEGLTFSCGSPAVEISHPRTTDPSFNAPLEITATSNTSITVNVGDANGYTGAHTFVSAIADAVTANPAKDFGTSYVNDEAYEASKALQANRQFIIDETTAWINGRYPNLDYSSTKCERDVGWFIDAAAWDIQHGSNSATVHNSRMYYDHAVAILPIEERHPTAAAFDHVAEVAGQIVRNEIVDAANYAEYDVSNATYDPVTGISSLTIGSHDFEPGDRIRLNQESITFSCANTASNTVINISHPRPTDPSFNTPITVLSVTPTSITIDVGDAGGYTGAHTFVSADSGAVRSAENQQVRSAGSTYSATNATYDPVTGDTVLTVGKHQFTVGDRITIDEGAITFSCANTAANTTVEISHPRSTDPMGGNTPATITEVTANTITFNSGNAGGYTGAHTFVSAEPESIRSSDFYTPVDASYNPTTGISTIDIGTHNLREGDRVILAEESITFSCANTVANTTVNISHPRATDPKFNEPITIISATSNTITIDVGDAGGYTGAHTFVSADANAVKKANMAPAYTPSTATYDPTTGISVLTIGTHRLEKGDWIIMDQDSITFSCANTATGVVTTISHPRATDPAFNTPVEVLETTDSTIKIQVGAAPNGYAGVHTFVSANVNCVKKASNPTTSEKVESLLSTVATMIRHSDFGELPAVKEPAYDDTVIGYDSALDTDSQLISGSSAKYQQEIIDYIRETYNGLGYNTDFCYRDIGYIVDAVSEDLEYGGNDATVNAATYYFNNAINILPENQREPTRLAYEYLANVVEDIIEETTVTPTSGNSSTQDKSGTPGSATIAAAGKDLVNIISAIVDDNSTNGIPESSGAPAMMPSRTFARKALQNNKEFIQEEIINFINDEYFTFDSGKCARDTGYILDAVRRDVETGANYNSLIAGKVYRSGNPGTEVVVQDQLAETVQAVNWIQKDIESRLTGTALTRATAAFENLKDAMINDYDPETVGYVYGVGSQGSNYINAQTGLQLNKDFLKSEAIAWIAINAPGLTYDADKCRRDIGYIVDAISYDVQHDCNVGMLDVARMYFENGLSILPADQRSATSQLYTHLGNVSELLVTKQTVTPTAGNTTPQEKLGFGPVAAGIAQDVQDGWNLVADVIAANTFDAAPAAREAQSTLGTDYDYNVEAAIIGGRLSTLSTGVTKYLKDQFNYLEYNQNKCRRDVGYMVDALSHDIQYGGNSAVWNAAQIYFVNAVNLLPVAQREPTRRAFTHMADVVWDIIRNEEITVKTGNRWTPSSATYDVSTGEAVLTIGKHTLNAGDYIKLAKESLTFSCGSPAVQISHPRTTDPAFDKPLKITSVGLNTITVNVGSAKGYDGAHTFVSASKNAVTQITGNHIKQDRSGLVARRRIANEAKEKAMIIANVVYENNPTALPYKVEPLLDWATADLKDSKQILDRANESLTKDMINFITKEYKGLSYPQDKCRRDVGIIVDALSHDINYNTNYATRLNANMYFSYGTSVLPYDQRQQTAEFYAEMANYVSDIVQELAPGQDVSGVASTSAIGEEVASLVRIIEEAIRRDSLDAVPEIREPDTSWVDEDLIWAGKEIDDNLDVLSDEVTTWINKEYNVLDYDKSKCYRDGHYLLDAFSFDLNYGGNSASRWNADFYFWNNIFRIPADQQVPTGQAYRVLGRLARDCVLGKLPGQVVRTDVSTKALSEEAEELGMIFYRAFLNNDVNALGPLVEPNFDYDDNKEFKFARLILNNNRINLQKEVQRFIGMTYKFIDLPKTRRDAGNILEFIANDFKYTNPTNGDEGSDQGTRSVVAALFNIDSKHVFPVFNPPTSFSGWQDLRFKGTVQSQTQRDALTGMKRNDAYIIPTSWNGNRYDGVIHYWNGTSWETAGNNNVDLLESFYFAWQQMRDYITGNLSPNLAHTQMVNGLFNDVLIQGVLRPNFLTFGSLVESIAHQFNGASAGVNRNALPLNFRNLGSAISATASVLSEDGGRIRWSGADELNNQYFARGLRINGRTGRIEGRPFTSSVRKLARRASNSRAAL